MEPRLAYLRSMLYCMVCMFCLVGCHRFDEFDTAPIVLAIDDATTTVGYTDGETISSRERQRWRAIPIDVKSPKGIESTITEKPLASDKLKCTRYCIQRTETKDKKNGMNEVRRVNLYWSSNDAKNADTEDLIKLAPGNDDALNANNSNTITAMCAVYLDLGCDTAGPYNFSRHEEEWISYDERTIEDTRHDKLEGSPSESYRKLMEWLELNGHTEVAFHLEDGVYGIRIDIRGNVMRASIDLPPTNGSEKELVLAISRQIYGNKGVKVHLQNPPRGDWRLILDGRENSTYSILVTASTRQKDVDTSTNNDIVLGSKVDKREASGKETLHHTLFMKLTNATYEATTRTSIDTEIFNVSKEITENVVSQGTNEEMTEIVSQVSENIRSSLEDPFNDVNVNIKHHGTNPTDFLDPRTSPTKSKTKDRFFEYRSLMQKKQHPFNTEYLSVPRDFTQNQQKIQTRSSDMILDKIIFDDDERLPSNWSVSRMGEVASDRELTDTEEFARIGEKETIEKRKIVLDVNVNSNLFVMPGTIHRIFFDVTNNDFQTIRCIFKVRSLPLRAIYIQPFFTWIPAGRTSNVFVDIEVPTGTNQDVINTLTLYVQGTELTEKSVYLYVQSSKITDDVKPTIEYSFNNNCMGKLNKDRCEKSRWSVDIRIQDSDSGLRHVVSTPNEIYPASKFISGTRSPVTFYYSATCCSTTAKITATDLLNNYNTQTIDVTAWDNLSQGEIAAVTIGALFIVLLIILIVLIVLYCIRKRKSQDFPYTQRYGSRPPASAERTSF